MFLFSLFVKVSLYVAARCPSPKSALGNVCSLLTLQLTYCASGLDIEPLDSSQPKLDADVNRSASTPGSDRRSAFMVVGPHVHSFRRHLRSLRRGRRYVTGPARHEPIQRGPLISEPGPVDFRQYGVVARMWMEQVRCA